ncbi:MAG: exosortase/archaeosortase family protein [Armatimonadetes bacterium]|nr:exosortase/archaeosortase family protein [Armatimonadota bacterium]
MADAVAARHGAESPAEKTRTPAWRQAHLPFLAGTALLLLWYRGVIAFWQAEWFGSQGYYAHGPLVPLLAAFLVWQRRDQLARTPVRASAWGVVVVLLGGAVKLLSTWVSTSGVEAFASVSFPVVLWGLALGIYGGGIARRLIGPAAFLWLMCPLPGYSVAELSFPLQLQSTRIGATLANTLGVSVYDQGTTLLVGNLSLFVDVACSGFKAVLTLLTLSAFAAATSRLRVPHRAALLLSALPVGLAANGVRIAAIAWAADRWGQAGAVSAHDYSGLVVLGLACLGMMAIARMLGWLSGTDTW